MPRLRAHAQRVIQQPGKALDDEEPESQPTLPTLARRRCAEEFAEDVGLQGSRNTRPGVADRNRQLAIGFSAGDAD